MIAIIKVENNLQEILKYLEKLGLVSTTNEKLTEAIKTSCNSIFINNDMTIECGFETPSYAISLKEFKQCFLNGIWLKPGMSLRLNDGEIIVVIPHKKHRIAFVSYSYGNNWFSELTPSRRDNIKYICDIPDSISIEGDILWQVQEIKLNDNDITKEELIERIKNFEGNISVKFD